MVDYYLTKIFIFYDLKVALRCKAHLLLHIMIIGWFGHICKVYGLCFWLGRVFTKWIEIA